MTFDMIPSIFAASVVISIGWLVGRSVYVFAMIGADRARLKVLQYAAKVAVRRKADAAVAKARKAAV